MLNGADFKAIVQVYHENYIVLQMFEITAAPHCKTKAREANEVTIR